MSITICLPIALDSRRFQDAPRSLRAYIFYCVSHPDPIEEARIDNPCSADVWPDAKFTALGAFIFLRFISPALVSPETIDIELPSDNTAIRRGLLIITKIIQNLANNVRFGKEVHMMCFNDFLQSNIIRVMRFLTDVNVSRFLYLVTLIVRSLIVILVLETACWCI